jgi:hypothetical protein
MKQTIIPRGVRAFRVLPVLLYIFLFIGHASAQWLNHSDPTTPRLPDGKPNLSAPAPRKADGKPSLAGIWERVTLNLPTRPFGTPNTLSDRLVDVTSIPMQPWAEALFKERFEKNLGGGRPSERCLPHGIPDAMLPGALFKFIETPAVTLLLYEEFNHYRQIFTDGRSFPDNDPQPAWFGYSIGKWDGDTFVVETMGFNDQTWLDDSGHPHTEAMRTTEKFHRTDFGHMDLKVTIDDPKAYTRPWTVSIPLELIPDTELIEDVCDNERDSVHINAK